MVLYFRIVLLSQARTEALLSNQTITGLNIDNLNIEEIRKLRDALDMKERKRVRERDKVLGFVIGMIIPIGLILYITLNISCRFEHQKVLTLNLNPADRPTLLPICSVTATNKGTARLTVPWRRWLPLTCFTSLNSVRNL